MIFEPVNADHTPTPPGRLSHTVLLSTLYRQEQPILRYDLGDFSPTIASRTSRSNRPTSRHSRPRAANTRT